MSVHNNRFNPMDQIDKFINQKTLESGLEPDVGDLDQRAGNLISSVHGFAQAIINDQNVVELSAEQINQRNQYNTKIDNILTQLNNNNSDGRFNSFISGLNGAKQALNGGIDSTIEKNKARIAAEREARLNEIKQRAEKLTNGVHSFAQPIINNPDIVELSTSQVNQINTFNNSIYAMLTELRNNNEDGRFDSVISNLSSAQSALNGGVYGAIRRNKERIAAEQEAQRLADLQAFYDGLEGKEFNSYYELLAAISGPYAPDTKIEKVSEDGYYTTYNVSNTQDKVNPASVTVFDAARKAEDDKKAEQEQKSGETPATEQEAQRLADLQAFYDGLEGKEFNSYYELLAAISGPYAPDTKIEKVSEDGYYTTYNVSNTQDKVNPASVTVFDAARKAEDDKKAEQEQKSGETPATEQEAQRLADLQAFYDGLEGKEFNSYNELLAAISGPYAPDTKIEKVSEDGYYTTYNVSNTQDKVNPASVTVFDAAKKAEDEKQVEPITDGTGLLDPLSFTSLEELEAAIANKTVNLRNTFCSGVYCQRRNPDKPQGDYTDQKHYVWNDAKNRLEEIPGLYYIKANGTNVFGGTIKNAALQSVLQGYSFTTTDGVFTKDGQYYEYDAATNSFVEIKTKQPDEPKVEGENPAETKDGEKTEQERLADLQAFYDGLEGREFSSYEELLAEIAKSEYAADTVIEQVLVDGNYITYNVYNSQDDINPAAVTVYNATNPEGETPTDDDIDETRGVDKNDDTAPNPDAAIMTAINNAITELKNGDANRIIDALNALKAYSDKVEVSLNISSSSAFTVTISYPEGGFVSDAYSFPFDEKYSSILNKLGIPTISTKVITDSQKASVLASIQATAVEEGFDGKKLTPQQAQELHDRLAEHSELQGNFTLDEYKAKANELAKLIAKEILAAPGVRGADDNATANPAIMAAINDAIDKLKSGDKNQIVEALNTLKAYSYKVDILLHVTSSSELEISISYPEGEFVSDKFTFSDGTYSDILAQLKLPVVSSATDSQKAEVLAGIKINAVNVGFDGKKLTAKEAQELYDRLSAHSELQGDFTLDEYKNKANELAKTIANEILTDPETVAARLAFDPSIKSKVEHISKSVENGNCKALSGLLTDADRGVSVTVEQTESGYRINISYAVGEIDNKIELEYTPEISKDLSDLGLIEYEPPRYDSALKTKVEGVIASIEAGQPESITALLNDEDMSKGVVVFAVMTDDGYELHISYEQAGIEKAIPLSIDDRTTAVIQNNNLLRTVSRTRGAGVEPDVDPDAAVLPDPEPLSEDEVKALLNEYYGSTNVNNANASETYLGTLLTFSVNNQDGSISNWKFYISKDEEKSETYYKETVVVHNNDGTISEIEIEYADKERTKIKSKEFNVYKEGSDIKHSQTPYEEIHNEDGTITITEKIYGDPNSEDPTEERVFQKNADGLTVKETDYIYGEDETIIVKEYDSSGHMIKLTKTVNPAEDENEREYSQNKVEIIYDSDGHVTRMVETNGHGHNTDGSEYYDYRVETVYYTDVRVRTEYDSDKRITKRTSTKEGGSEVVTEYIYDSEGNFVKSVTTETNPDENTVTVITTDKDGNTTYETKEKSEEDYFMPENEGEDEFVEDNGNGKSVDDDEDYFMPEDEGEDEFVEDNGDGKNVDNDEVTGEKHVDEYYIDDYGFVEWYDQNGQFYRGTKDDFANYLGYDNFEDAENNGFQPASPNTETPNSKLSYEEWKKDKDFTNDVEAMLAWQQYLYGNDSSDGSNGTPEVPNYEDKGFYSMEDYLRAVREGLENNSKAFYQKYDPPEWSKAGFASETEYKFAKYNNIDLATFILMKANGWFDGVDIDAMVKDYDRGIVCWYDPVTGERKEGTHDTFAQTLGFNSYDEYLEHQSEVKGWLDENGNWRQGNKDQYAQYMGFKTWVDYNTAKEYGITNPREFYNDNGDPRIQPIMSNGKQIGNLYRNSDGTVDKAVVELPDGTTITTYGDGHTEMGHTDPNTGIRYTYTYDEKGKEVLKQAIDKSGKDVTNDVRADFEKSANINAVLKDIANGKFGQGANWDRDGAVSALRAAGANVINLNQTFKNLSNQQMYDILVSNKGASYEQILAKMAEANKEAGKKKSGTYAYSSNYGQIGGQSFGLGDQGFNDVFGGANGWGYDQQYSLGLDGKWYQNGSQETRFTFNNPSGGGGGGTAHY